MRDVLVVEDDRVVLSAVAGVCRAEGLEVDETTNVEEAVARLYGSSYRLAIVDLMLPQESGFNLLRGARAARRARATVVISGYATTLSALESFQLGAFDFLPKPFDVDELLGVSPALLHAVLHLLPLSSVAESGIVIVERASDPIILPVILAMPKSNLLSGIYSSHASIEKMILSWQALAVLCAIIWGLVFGLAAALFLVARRVVGIRGSPS